MPVPLFLYNESLGMVTLSINAWSTTYKAESVQTTGHGVSTKKKNFPYQNKCSENNNLGECVGDCL